MFHEVLANLLDLEVNKLYVAQDIYVHPYNWIRCLYSYFKNQPHWIFLIFKNENLNNFFFWKNELLFESNYNYSFFNVPNLTLACDI